MTARRPLALLTLCALAALAACRREAGPADRYRAFAAAAREGRAEEVWSMLSERSRAELDRRARALAASAPGVVEASGRQLVLGDLGAVTPPPTEVIVVRESRDAAIVSVATGGGSPREVSLVREGGVWRVVVPFDK